MRCEGLTSASVASAAATDTYLANKLTRWRFRLFRLGAHLHSGMPHTCHAAVHFWMTVQNYYCVFRVKIRKCSCRMPSQSRSVDGNDSTMVDRLWPTTIAFIRQWNSHIQAVYARCERCCNQSPRRLLQWLRRWSHRVHSVCAMLQRIFQPVIDIGKKLSLLEFGCVRVL